MHAQKTLLFQHNHLGTADTYPVKDGCIHGKLNTVTNTDITGNWIEAEKAWTSVVTDKLVACQVEWGLK